MDPQKLSDKNLLSRAEYFGGQARYYRYRFIGLLPEINRRRLYERKHCKTIFDFAKLICGMSEEYVKRALSIHRALEKAPKLQQLFESGEVSMNQLARVVSVATPENQNFWVKQVKELPQKALEALVRDFRAKETVTNENNFENSLFDPALCARTKLDHDFSESASDDKKLILEIESDGQLNILANNAMDRDTSTITPAFVESFGSAPATAQSLSQLKLSEQTAKRLIELQHKGFDLDQLLNELLDERDSIIENEKSEIAAELKPTNSRYIPAATRKLIKKEYGTKCSIQHCTKKAAETHHTNRFSIAKIHDPRFLAPLCRGHHILAHSADAKFQKFLSSRG